MPKFLAGCHYNEEEISRHLKKNIGYWPVQMNGNKFATGQILEKPVEVVKGWILAGWAQKCPEPWWRVEKVIFSRERKLFTSILSDEGWQTLIHTILDWYSSDIPPELERCQWYHPSKKGITIVNCSFQINVYHFERYVASNQKKFAKNQG